MSPERASAAALRDRLMAWVLNEAFPVWATTGLSAHGGFHEAIAPDGQAIDLPRRARVQPRQIYCYAMAPRLGFDPVLSRKAVGKGVDFFLAHHIRPDGLARMLVNPAGAVLQDEVDLYDQGFALLGLVSGYVALDRPPALAAAALKLKGALEAGLAHPYLGYEEARPRRLPLMSNPHMHLFEAALAWLEATGETVWRGMSDDLARLCLTRLIGPNGGLGEYFDGDWGPAPGVDGLILWPGHQFEWAWLLFRWGELTGTDEGSAAAMRLIERGLEGIDPARGVAFHAILDDGTPHEEYARLWTQTEWLKAMVVAATHTGDDRWWDLTARAGEALGLYLDTPGRGLWRDMLQKDGRFGEESARASSFYHIVCAILTLDRGLEVGGAPR